MNDAMFIWSTGNAMDYGCCEGSRHWLMLRAIPNKNAKYVCFELNSLFGLIGYPHIFHIDNGSEFTAEQVVGMLKSWNQTILTVTGRPRKPSDQGSVEIINRLVKRVINSVLASEVQKGKLHPNWTKYL